MSMGLGYLAANGILTVFLIAAVAAQIKAPVPVKDFWSFIVHDSQHRSMLETDQKQPDGVRGG